MAIFMEFHQIPVNPVHYPGQIKKVVEWLQEVLVARYDDRLNISLGHSNNDALPHCLDIRSMNARNIIIGFSAHGFLNGWGMYDGSCCEYYNPLNAYIMGLNTKQGSLDVCLHAVMRELDRWTQDGVIGFKSV
ncbi:MAG: hypothetical protein K0Q77_2282 [Anaerosporomusa subterranea]|nr:hypothetical protein [Anaerosporomusa subterranea]